MALFSPRLLGVRFGGREALSGMEGRISKSLNVERDLSRVYLMFVKTVNPEPPNRQLIQVSSIGERTRQRDVYFGSDIGIP